MKKQFRFIKKLFFPHGRISYSQESEDIILLELAELHNKKNGFYVDVGAHHPLRLSNTAIFYQKGWRGINIDANPGCMKIFSKLRNEDINIECAVSNELGEKIFYRYTEPALNGLDNDRSSELKDSSFRLLDKIPVPTKPLSNILDEHIHDLKKPNFLSIDAEGHDYEVLKSNNWDKYKFDWIIVECSFSDNESLNKSETYLFLKSKGYTLRAFTGRSCLFQKK